MPLYIGHARASIESCIEDEVRAGIPEGQLLGLQHHPGLTLDGRRAAVMLVLAQALPSRTLLSLGRGQLEVQWVPADVLHAVPTHESANEELGGAGP